MILSFDIIPNPLRDVSYDQMVVVAIVCGIAAFFVFGGIIYVASLQFAARMDYERLHIHFAAQGGRVLSCQRAFFGKGWIGSKERIYEIRYADANGNVRDVTCKTNMFSGVYVTDDRLVRAGKILPPPLPPNESRLQFLEEENRRLREELEKLKARFGSNR